MIAEWGWPARKVEVIPNGVDTDRFPTPAGRYEIVDAVHVKLAKVAVFVLMMTRFVTERRQLDRLFWILAIGALFLGMEAYEKPLSAFAHGRLEGVGGPDVADANRFGGFMAGDFLDRGIDRSCDNPFKARSCLSSPAVSPLMPLFFVGAAARVNWGSRVSLCFP